MSKEGLCYGHPLMPDPFEMIETPDALRTLVTRAQGEACLAVDTEFVWDRTYYARLGLVQVGFADGSCFMVDPIALTDVTPLGELLANPEITKILHDAPQDLMILRRATGASTHNVFDTRRAAGFSGLGSTLSLAKLLAELIDVHLPKAHTRVDWTKRPFAPAYLEYAADDVRYLPQVAAMLRERARSGGVEAWMNEELATLDGSALYEEKPLDELYLRIRGGAGLRPCQLAALRELAAWLEQKARDADLPRRWLMEDGELVELAAEMPRRQEELSRCQKLNPQTAQRHGEALLAAIERGRTLPESTLPPPISNPGRDRSIKAAVDARLQQIAIHAKSHGVDPELVASRNEAALLIKEGDQADPASHPLLRGWRAELMACA